MFLDQRICMNGDQWRNWSPCLWTFHTNSLLHEYFLSLNTCISDKKFVLFTWTQCLIMNNNNLIILMNCILNDIATCNLFSILVIMFSPHCYYPASRNFSLAWLLAFTKSFAWLVCCVVSLFTPREKPLQQAAWDFRWACARLIIRCYRDNDVNFIT